MNVERLEAPRRAPKKATAKAGVPRKAAAGTGAARKAAATRSAAKKAGGRKAAVAATTSVIRWNEAEDDAIHCMNANETPETSAPGHTSQTCFHVPPSIFTNAATSQNGTSTETKGS